MRWSAYALERRDVNTYASETHLDRSLIVHPGLRPKLINTHGVVQWTHFFFSLISYQKNLLHVSSLIKIPSHPSPQFFFFLSLHSSFLSSPSFHLFPHGVLSFLGFKPVWGPGTVKKGRTYMGPVKSAGQRAPGFLAYCWLSDHL